MRVRSHEAVYLRPTGDAHTFKLWRHKDEVKEPARQDLSAEKLRDMKISSILSEPFLWTILDGILSCMTETCGQCWKSLARVRPKQWQHQARTRQQCEPQHLETTCNLEPA